uniref:Protein kinase domain-containing protein n=1 Tax=Compsopogon caeruleus TaxID=31354 RepID=A0A7S1T5I3_9RHOD|mmetsp:Transcript_1103/g.2308  ORF Transcript_1103/g.2308 Transcript_1103/m.2308 type:complete len:674 (+) Transcript_1103:82-2103(+)
MGSREDPTGRYERSDVELGRGAFKVVYRGFDTKEALEVAWNAVDMQRLSEAERQKVAHEVDILSKLNHPNVISLFASWKVMDRSAKKVVRLEFITELMVSGTLREYIVKARTVKLKVIRRWGLNILSAIDYLHNLTPPVVHRDLKCSNIFVNGNTGEVKVGDLGLACERLDNKRCQTVIGTPEFMSPELFDEEYTEKVDVYAFGMVLLEMITGQFPYRECTSSAQVFKKVYRGIYPDDLTNMRESDMKLMITRCLNKERSRPSAAELLKHPLFKDWESDTGDLTSSHLIGKEPLTPELQSQLFLGQAVVEAPSSSQAPTVVNIPTKQAVTVTLRVPVGDQMKRVEFQMTPNEDCPLELARELISELNLPDSTAPIIIKQIESQVDQASVAGVSMVSTAASEPAEDKVSTTKAISLESGEWVSPVTRGSSMDHELPSAFGSALVLSSSASLKNDEDREKDSFPPTRSSAGSSHGEHDPRLFAMSMSLLESSAKGRQDLVEKRLHQGADVNYRDYDSRTPLHLAVEEGHEAIVDILLGHGADPYQKDRWGNRALDILRRRGNQSMTVIFEKHRIDMEDFDIPDKHLNGLELLHFAANGALERVEQHLDLGTDPNFADYDQRTPLHLASVEGHTAVVRLLLSRGAKADVKDRFGRTPLDDAIAHRVDEVISLLQNI